MYNYIRTYSSNPVQQPIHTYIQQKPCTTQPIHTSVATLYMQQPIRTYSSNPVQQPIRTYIQQQPCTAHYTYIILQQQPCTAQPIRTYSRLATYTYVGCAVQGCYYIISYWKRNFCFHAKLSVLNQCILSFLPRAKLELQKHELPSMKNFDRLHL